MTSKYTKSAKGQECQVRFPFCNHSPETTVFAHFGGAGMGRKRADIHGAYACSDCHDALDWRVDRGYDINDLRLAHFEAMLRTQEIMIKNGVLVL